MTNFFLNGGESEIFSLIDLYIWLYYEKKIWGGDESGNLNLFGFKVWIYGIYRRIYWAETVEISNKNYFLWINTHYNTLSYMWRV